jgi:hypothetical protein
MNENKAVRAYLELVGSELADITFREILANHIEHQSAVKVPTPGAIVWYQTDGRNFDYYLPAIVNVTCDNQHVEGLEQAGIPILVLDSPLTVHLEVSSPGVNYKEYAVAYDPDGGRRTWRWPDLS